MKALSLIDGRIKPTGAYMIGPHVDIHGNGVFYAPWIEVISMIIP